MRLAPGLHRIGADLVNSYLVADATGVTIIDAGLPGHWKDLLRELRAAGHSVRDVRGVVLTHGDTDHLGFSERLRADHGVPVYVHSQDAALARGESPKAKVAWGARRMGPLVRFLWYAATRGGLRPRYVKEVIEVEDDVTLELPGRPRVIHVPGHSPGSIALHSAAVDALFVGDALTTGHVLTGVQGPQPAPFTLAPDQAISSLARLATVQARWVLPGHGAPWSGGAEQAVRRIREAST